MTLPTGVVTRGVTFKLLFTALDPTDPSGAPVTVAPAPGSSATFTAGPASLLLVDGATTLDMLPESRTVAIGADGTITATLECTDTNTINPVDWAWTVSFSLSGGMTRAPFSFQLPAAAGALDLATVVPVTDTGGVLTTQGPPGPRGPAGIEPQGTWDAGTAYATDDAVYRNGSTYWAVQGSTGVDPATDSSSTYWHIMAEKGAPGDVSSVDGVSATAGTGDVALGALKAANNLSDVANAVTARSNIGAGTSDFSGAYGDLTGKPTLATVAATGAYGDLSGKPTLGTAAAANTGTTSGNVPVLNASGQLDMARLASGTPSGSKFVRDDGTLAVPAAAAASLTSQAAVLSSDYTLVNSNTWYTYLSATFAAGTWLVTTVAAPTVATGSSAFFVGTQAVIGSGTGTITGPTSASCFLTATYGLDSLSYAFLLTCSTSVTINFQAWTNQGSSNAKITARAVAASSVAGSTGYSAVKIA